MDAEACGNCWLQCEGAGLGPGLAQQIWREVKKTYKDTEIVGPQNLVLNTCEK